MCSSSERSSWADCVAGLLALVTPPPRPLSGLSLLVELREGTSPGFGVPSTGGFLAFWVELVMLPVMSPRTLRGVFCGNDAPSCLPGFSGEGRRNQRNAFITTKQQREVRGHVEPEHHKCADLTAHIPVRGRPGGGLATTH